MAAQGVDDKAGVGERRQGHTVAQLSSLVQDNGVAQRIIHDVVPAWDEKDPSNQAKLFLKLLSRWLSMTLTRTSQRRMAILHDPPWRPQTNLQHAGC